MINFLCGRAELMDCLNRIKKFLDIYVYNIALFMKNYLTKNKIK